MGDPSKFSIKVKLDLCPKDAAILDGQSRILNWAYNHLLSTANSLREQYRETQGPEVAKTLYSSYGLRDLLPDLKKEKPFLKSVHSSPLKNAALRLCESIRSFQSAKKSARPKKRKKGWPRFRSQKKKWFSLLYDEPGKGFKVDGKDLRLSLGVSSSSSDEGKRLYVAGRLEKPLSEFGEARVLNLRITKTGSEYFAIFAVEKILPKTKSIQRLIALDPNHKNLSYGVSSIGEAVEIENPYFLRSLDRRIDQLKARRDKCQRRSRQKTLRDGRKIWLPSKRWSKFNSLVEDAYRKRREQTKIFLYTVANRLYREYDFVSIGDYTPQGGGITRGMRRAMNNGSLIGRFKETLSWVALRGGKSYMEWNERGSTKTCSHCDQEREESISPDIRSWRCDHCQTFHLRDENAAQNGLRRTAAKKKLPCLGLLERTKVCSRRAWRFDGLGIGVYPHPGIIDGAVARVTGAASKKLNSGDWTPEPEFV